MLEALHSRSRVPCTPIHLTDASRARIRFKFADRDLRVCLGFQITRATLLQEQIRYNRRLRDEKKVELSALHAYGIYSASRQV